jgi:RNA polymerase sigma-70 factor (ECF subfamily)
MPLLAQQDQYKRLIEPYRAALGRAAYRLTASHAEAEDLVQDTLLRAYTRLHLVQSGDAVGGWLYKIQLNLFRNGYRRADVLARPRTSLVSLDEGCMGKVDGTIAIASTADPEQSALHSQRHAAILHALAGLPPAYREAVLLCDVEGQSYQQVAERTGVPIGTVRSRINRGRKRLRRRLLAWQDAD